MTEHAVVIAGGGPTGLMLAAELALAGVDVVVVERRASQELDGSRAGGLHSRTIEVLDQRGVAERFLSAGQIHPAVGFAGSVWTSATSRPATTTCSRCGSATSSASWPAGSTSSGCRSFAAARSSGFAQDDTGVDVELSDGTSLRAEYLVGCDGGRSVVRKAAGIDFPGLDPSTSWMIAEVEMDEEPEIGMRREGGGIGPVDREDGGGPYGVVLKERAGRTRPASPRWRISARHSSSPTGRTSARTARTGSPGSPT